MALCIDATLTGLVVAASLSLVTESEETPIPIIGTGTMTSELSTASMTAAPTAAVGITYDASNVTMSGNLSEVSFTVACPIEFVTSCFSFGGWDDDLGWDNEKGWKD